MPHKIAGLVVTGVTLAAAPQLLVAQEHVQPISGASQTYTVSPGGTADPVNHSVSIRNVGSTSVVNPKIVLRGRDWSTVEHMLAGIVTPEMSAEQKARAIWSFARTNRYHWVPATRGFDDDDPVKLFNAYGYGFCNDVSSAQAALYELLDLPFRRRNLGAHSEHSVIEVYYDNDWHVLDADRDGLYLELDNKTIAGVDDLIADPGLVARAGPAHADLVDIYANTRPGGWSTSPAMGHTMGLTLRPGEGLTLNWQSSGRYHYDGKLEKPPPPLLAEGELASPFDPSVSGARQQLVRDSWIRMSGEDGRDLALSPSLLAITGELLYAVASPYPIVGTRFDGDLYRAGPNDRIEVAAAPDVRSVHLDWLDLAEGWYDIAGLSTEASGLVTRWDDGSMPALHPAAPGTTATLTYRMRRGQDQRTLVGGEFFRRGAEDGLEIALSVNGLLWQVVWRASSDQVGTFTHQEDITSWISIYDSFLVQFRFRSNAEKWDTGLNALMLDGIEPYEFHVIWSTEGADPAEAIDHFSTSVDFTDAIVPRGHPPVYGYLIRIRLAAPMGSMNVGLDRFALTTAVQVNPRSLPDLLLGDNEVVYSDEADGPHEVEVTHRWEERNGPRAPSTPAAPLSPSLGGPMAWHDEMTFQWQRSVDPNGEPVYLYRVEICDSASCLSPLSSIFTVGVHSTDVGPDGTLGTADDGAVVDAAPTWTTPFGKWLIPGETYYWRVRAADRSLLYSPWSGPWPFEVAELPPGTPGPTLTLSDSPSGGPIEVTSPFVDVAGEARAGGATVASVAWRTDSGASGTADGTSSWSVADVPLHAGRNTVTITATDVAGQTTTQDVVFTLPRIDYILAEGSTGFFDLDVAIANPNDSPAPISIEFLREDGQRVVQSDVLAPRSQRTIRVDEIPGLESTAVSTIVKSTEALPLVVDRTMFWDGSRYGGHATGAVNGASTRWWFAEGFQGAFETFVLLANGNNAQVSVTLSFLLDSGDVVTREVGVPPLARRTIYAGNIPELVGRAFSIEVASDAPIVAERAMYFGVNRFWDGGHASPGTDAPAREWFFAEGATGSYFNTFLLVGNPGTSTANVHITYLLPNGEQIGKDHQVAGRSRLTLNVALEDPALAATTVSAVVESDSPIVAERAMYWGGDWREGHDALGVSAPALRWGVADGRVGTDLGFETFILIANPDEQRTARLSVSFLTSEGETVQRSYDVPAKTRFTIPVSSFVPELQGKAFGATIESVNGVPIFVERATYWSASSPWDGGVAVPAARLPDR
ncbi:MAG: transglutaminase domain-containing protein [Vicinamibacteraceae bacterium]